MDHSTILIFLIFLAALTYASVGHAGASGYIAAMALMGVAQPVMKPAALTLNLLVAGIGTVRFYRAGHFQWRLLWPFALGSVPLAYFGGATQAPPRVFATLVGVALLAAAFRLIPAAPRHATD